jgi:chemotaxis protein methyltransferase CheR
MATLSMTPQVFVILTSLIEQRAGLHYAPEDQDLLEDKVSVRALEAGFTSLFDYYYFLKYDPAGREALDALIDSLLVHETYFFREAHPMEVLADEVLVPAVRAGRRPRVWCAACSTGEEPLTLAMMLAERGVLKDVELVASDLSPRALERARAGEHNLRALRSLPPGVEGRWLDVEGGRPRVRPEVAGGVDWRRVNLVDAAAVAALGTFDAILCRNVLIYFQDATALRVVDLLASALVPGGVLLVGTSESLMRFGTALNCEERRGAFFYTKAGT